MTEQNHAPDIDDNEGHMRRDAGDRDTQGHIRRDAGGDDTGGHIGC